MSLPTAGTEWPANVEVPSPVKDVINLFFTLADDKSPNAGDRLADEVFTDDAIQQMNSRRVEGGAQIRQGRKNAWNTVTFRDHRVLKVFASNERADDLLTICTLDQKFTNGNGHFGEFTARFQIAGVDTRSPRIKSYRVWSDTAPLVKAQQG